MNMNEYEWISISLNINEYQWTSMNINEYQWIWTNMNDFNCIESISVLWSNVPVCANVIALFTAVKVNIVSVSADVVKVADVLCMSYVTYFM